MKQGTHVIEQTYKTFNDKTMGERPVAIENSKTVWIQTLEGHLVKRHKMKHLAVNIPTEVIEL